MPSDKQIDAVAAVLIRNGCEKASAPELARYCLMAAEGAISGQDISLFDPDMERGAQSWPQDFAAKFRAKYPRKVGMAAALRKLDIIHKKGNVRFDVLMAGVGRYAASVADTEMQFIAHPMTWLNQGRWEDEEKSLDRSTDNGKNGFAQVVREFHGV